MGGPRAEVAKGTLYPKANSWYLGSNIPGKPRGFGVYLGGLNNYRDRCNRIAESGYEGFSFGQAVPPGNHPKWSAPAPDLKT